MIDLHLHLDGSLAPALVRELAQTQGLPLPAGSLEEALSAPADCQSLNDYLRCFDLPVAVLQTRQALTQSVQELTSRLQGQGLLYAELRFAPSQHTRQGLTQRQVVEAALAGRKAAGGEDFCACRPTDRATLGEIVSLLESFRASREDLAVPDLAEGSFSKKLWSAFESYYAEGSRAYPLSPRRDWRGSFTEFLRTPERGQVSVNVSGPGVTKGNHWHRSKWERFLVVSGEASIRLRRVGLDADGRPFPVDEYLVSGDEPMVVEMAPGTTHCIENLSDSRDLVTVMWANEPFDPEDPDTYFEEV